jgi:hypothetical protein
MFEMNVCFRIEMVVVVVVHFVCKIITFLWLQCLGFHISYMLISRCKKAGQERGIECERSVEDVA